MEIPESFEDILHKKLPSQKEKITMILTLLGCCGHFTEFIAKDYFIKDIPIEIKHALALSAANMVSLTTDRECEILDFSTDLKLGEQTQERCYRMFKKIVFLLYESIIEEENDQY